MKMSKPVEEQVEKYIIEVKNIIDRVDRNCVDIKVLIEENGKKKYDIISDEHSCTLVNGLGVGPFLDGLKKIKCEDLDEDEVEMGKEMFSSLPIEERQLLSTRENYNYLLIIFEVKNPKEGEEALVFVIDDFKWDITIINIENRETLFSTSEYLSRNI